MIASGIVMVLIPLVVFLWGQNATFWKELCGYVMVLDVKLILEGVSASNSPLVNKVNKTEAAEQCVQLDYLPGQ